MKKYSLQPYNTFGLDVQCHKLIKIKSEKDLLAVLPASPSEVFVLGGGSNILLTQTVQKTVLKNEIEGINTIREDDHHAFVEIGGGTDWHEFVSWAVENDLGGVENLALIPGTVGAAPIQNIGAYGVELKDVFEYLDCIFIQTGEKKTFYSPDCHFGYRDSIFKRSLKSKVFITKVCLKLNKKGHQINTSYGAINKQLEAKGIDSPGIRDVFHTVIEIRRSKLPDPAVLGNSGSFFKNPEIPLEQFLPLEKEYPNIVSYPLPDEMVKVPAGWLIEQCGWKGKVIGNVGCYEKQALVIVNYGNAKPFEIINLSKKIQKSVEKKFGIRLETEVNFV